MQKTPKGIVVFTFQGLYMTLYAILRPILYNILHCQGRLPVSAVDYNSTILYYREKLKN